MRNIEVIVDLGQLGEKGPLELLAQGKTVPAALVTRDNGDQQLIVANEEQMRRITLSHLARGQMDGALELVPTREGDMPIPIKVLISNTTSAVPELAQLLGSRYPETLVAG